MRCCRIHTREGDQALGGLSLNITQCPTTAPAQQPTDNAQSAAGKQLSALGGALYAVIAALVPYSVAADVGPSQVMIDCLAMKRRSHRFMCHACMHHMDACRPSSAQGA